MVGIAERKARRTKGGPETEAPPRRLFTVAEYLRMGEAGILGPEERTELIDGEILRMAPIGSPHAKCVRGTTAWWYANLPPDTIILVQDPIRIRPRSLPQPDIAVVRARPDGYIGEHPGVEDILLLIEVSDTTFAYDHGHKLDLYATAGIPEYWIFHVSQKRALVHRKPENGRYTVQFEVGVDGAMSPLAFPELTLTLSEILG